MEQTLWIVLEIARWTGYHIITVFFLLLTLYRKIDRAAGAMLSMLFVSNVLYVDLIRYAPDIEQVLHPDLTNWLSLSFGLWNTALVLGIASRMAVAYAPLALRFRRDTANGLRSLWARVMGVWAGLWGGLWGWK